jgi:hypothetical protein
MTVRDERAAALTRRYRDLADDFTRALPLLLDDLEAIGRRAMASWRYRVGGTIYEAADVIIYASGNVTVHAGTGGQPQADPPAPTDAQIAAWIERNPAKFEAWVRKQDRINGAPPPFDAPAKPAPRRRTTR